MLNSSFHSRLQVNTYDRLAGKLKQSAPFDAKVSAANVCVRVLCFFGVSLMGSEGGGWFSHPSTIPHGESGRDIHHHGEWGWWVVGGTPTHPPPSPGVGGTPTHPPPLTGG